MRIKLLGIVLLLALSSCVSKKEILYLQNADDANNTIIDYSSITIQPNDILNISVGALVPETAIPYNRKLGDNAPQNSIDLLKLEGYLVSKEKKIIFPVLGEITVENMTTAQLEMYLKDRLKEGGHLVDPTVSVRILNAKVTVLGEVKNPGTYSFSEESISIFQALGYAGDLTIKGVREDVLVVREIDGVRKITHLNLTSAELLNSPFYYVKPNDVIVVNQNNPKVKTAGFIGDVGTLLAVTTVVLSIVILLSR
ncbi:ligand-binding protein [Hanstruepera neustonica]|uniref:Ligand-binding protein n=1 Tax=Hanstruepera neustonica TaxID=1445657 RepID=A0A2K1DZL1_9FLAO|nr:polysaccharide biosynthesis/export family protein [Hanstruepera neustonica]PNQ73466.1 ligand-binding protein [Hanstruepera neustonica]